MYYYIDLFAIVSDIFKVYFYFLSDSNFILKPFKKKKIDLLSKPYTVLCDMPIVIASGIMYRQACTKTENKKSDFGAKLSSRIYRS